MSYAAYNHNRKTGSMQGVFMERSNWVRKSIEYAVLLKSTDARKAFEKLQILLDMCFIILVIITLPIYRYDNVMMCCVLIPWCVMTGYHTKFPAYERVILRECKSLPFL